MPENDERKNKNKGGEKGQNDTPYLTGKILIAMPNLGDPRFHKAVIFMCAHDDKGAMGLVINHLLPGIDMASLMEQLNIDMDEKAKMTSNGIPVMGGGPVETSRGFVLHSKDFEQKETIPVNDTYSVTGTVEALKAIADGEGPEKMRFILGYAGWTAGQLDREIQDNAWLVAPSPEDIIFEPETSKIWDKAVEALGIDPAMLSGAAGHA